MKREKESVCVYEKKKFDSNYTYRVFDDFPRIQHAHIVYQIPTGNRIRVMHFISYLSTLFTYSRHSNQLDLVEMINETSYAFIQPSISFQNMKRVRERERMKR